MKPFEKFLLFSAFLIAAFLICYFSAVSSPSSVAPAASLLVSTSDSAPVRLSPSSAAPSPSASWIDYEAFLRQIHSTPAKSATVKPSATKTPAPVKKPTTAPAKKTYIVNVATGVFHLPTCPAISQMHEENKIRYNCTREDLIVRKYKPCGRCNP